MEWNPPWCFGIIFHICLGFGNAEKFDVLSIENVPFPESSDIPAHLNATYTKEIAEFTVCSRFLFTSYNDWWNFLLIGNQPDQHSLYKEGFGFNTGFEVEGYQAIEHVVWRNVTGGGRGYVPIQEPNYHYPLLARNIQTGKWINTVLLDQQTEISGYGIQASHCAEGF